MCGNKYCQVSNIGTLNQLFSFGLFLSDSDFFKEAGAIYIQALKRFEEVLGSDHTSTLNTANNLGLLYTDQGKLAEAEAMYKQALDGYEKAWAPEHTSTLDTVNNPGNLYANEGESLERCSSWNSKGLITRQFSRENSSLGKGVFLKY